MILEVFTNVQSSKACSSIYHTNLLAKLATSNNVSILLNLLVLGSSHVKTMVLKIFKQLILIDRIPCSTFDQAAKDIIVPGSKAESIINAQVKIVNFLTVPFIGFLFRFALTIREKMWSKTQLDSEGGYAVSQELISTMRAIYERSSDEKSNNHPWHLSLKTNIEQIFEENKLSKFKTDSSIELETLFSLIRGCEYLGMMPC